MFPDIKNAMTLSNLFFSQCGMGQFVHKYVQSTAPSGTGIWSLAAKSSRTRSKPARPKLVVEWKVSVAALKQGAERRAEYARARSVTFGGGIAIEIDEITGLGIRHRRLGPRQMQLRRSKPNDERVWTLSGLVDEYRRLPDLLAQIQAFAGRLQDASDASRPKAAPGSGA